ncbi:protein-(glutamine-N5) methyltransferase, release factor-specific [Candidatus Pantoea edessiphila]|uniref:Release factor glutamine methyltransferase n=1 Tax=Candidatus Pantoea edessiphila TaxID=2044610 RepID=A0A2P5T2H5_9GAMM|nr:peptide chain release factor N(5)-glutamine methyltransferase [Candidatus Pantoea edessiphila]PPI88791.1 protein-(glutamine-N5) methyltransferase, release factor-specific [Candidatus Pantoea edessiphila]
MNIRDWLKKAIVTLYNSKNPKFDAEMLLSFNIGKSRTWLRAFDEQIINDKQLASLEQLLIRRLKGEPLAYLIGECEFWSLPLNVTYDTIIPRLDTEIIVEQSLIYISNSYFKVLDLGTGTGAIALAIATERPNCEIIGVDFIPTVVENARKNAKKLNIYNVDFVLSYWFDNLSPNKFDLIVSNPPYIEPNSIYLKLGGLSFEPISALVSSENGLSDLKIIIKNALNWLNTNGWLLLEHGWKQGEAVRFMMYNYGYRNINTIYDYEGNPRVTFGNAPK